MPLTRRGFLRLAAALFALFCAGSSDRYAELRKLLSSTPPVGTNVTIVSHGNPFRAVADAPYLAEGEAAVIRPLGNDGFRIVARIAKDGWDSLASP
jgi:hypothetical protein